MSRSPEIIVSISEIKEWMKNGVTRYPTDSSYDPELGSVQEKYGLTFTEARALFKDVRLKNIRVAAAPRFVIAEDQNAAGEAEVMEDTFPDQDSAEFSRTDEAGSEHIPEANGGDVHTDTTGDLHGEPSTSFDGSTTTVSADSDGRAIHMGSTEVIEAENAVTPPREPVDSNDITSF